MGFAGQVFAARVAIGLAFPSKQAMGQASQIIGAGAAALYKKMNTMQSKAAGERRRAAEKDLSDMQSRIEKHRNSLQQKLTAGQAKFSKSLKQANLGAKITAGKSMKAYKATQQKMGTAKSSKQLENTFAAGKRAFTDFANHVKKRSPDLAISLFGKKGGHDEFDFGKMSKIFAEGSSSQRAELLKIAKLEMENADRRKRNGLEEIRMMEIKTKWLMKTAQITAEQGANALEQLQDERQGFTDNANSARDFYGVVKGMADQRTQDEREHNEKLQEYLKEEKSLRTVLKDAINGETAALKLLEQGAERAAKKAMQFAEALKNNFGNALRESISALTAMFYKLQQNSQELIEFERELMNANSVFNLTRDELFKTSEVITQFGQSFGLEMQNGAEGLYQLASAGLSADAAAKVLPETLKLSMAVQGDHNTIAKLTTQTLMGFSMEMDQAAEVTDKFAHVIQKSLIEYEDLTSAVKFAMPFFTATGQSVDQLLGALEILTNRALEAGIAGRGLRQALAEFAEHADNNEAAFARMGLEIKKADGSMKDLTVIAKEYSDIIGPDAASNTELLTSLIEDLNVRGATAFVHLVQNADEFAEAVHNVENAGGELDEMVRIQNESMASQIQILKNNIQMIFFYNDGVSRANGAMNEFHSAILDGIHGFQDLLVEGEEGNKQLTEFGKTIQDVAVEAVKALTILLQDGVKFLSQFAGEGKQAIGVLKAYLLPIQILMKAIDFLGPRVTSLVIQFMMLNKIFSITAGITTLAQLVNAYTMRTIASTAAITAETAALEANSAAKGKNAVATAGAGGASGGGGIMSSIGGMFGFGGKKGITDKDIYKTDAGKFRYKGMKGGGFSSKEALMKKKGIKPQLSMMQKLAKLGRPIMMLGRALATAAGAAAAVVTAVAAMVAYGLTIMDSWGPIIDIFKGWGEAVGNLIKWIGGGLYWTLKKILMEVTNLLLWTGLFSRGLEDVGITTKNVMKEFGYVMLRTIMKVSMVFASFFGLAIMGFDMLFKGVYDLITGESSWPGRIWDGLFNNETGWLRWLTLGWWQNAWADLKGFLEGIEVPSVDLSTGLAMPEWLLDIYESGSNWLTGVFDDVLAGLINLKNSMPNINLSAIFGIEAFKVGWNAIATAMSSFAFEIDIPGFGISLPDWAGGHGFEWAGYKQTLSFGQWPTFEMGTAGSARASGGGQSGSSGIGVGTAGSGIGLEAALINAAQTGGSQAVSDRLGVGPRSDYSGGLARGGYVTPMAMGGFAKRGSYLVGEEGPELFQPSNSGQIINNSRTGSILRNQLNNSRMGAGMGGGATMMVDTLVANESKMGKSKISVDTFAGVV
jgi:TP901 family phage tail tape measure protein